MRPLGWAVVVLLAAAAVLGLGRERLAGVLTVARGATAPGAAEVKQPFAGAVEKRHKPKKKPYTSPSGLFIQERASKQLPGPGQHFSFGALRPWEDILRLLDEREERKLLLVVRHGQAVSNYLGDTLGPDEWYSVEGTCDYTDKDGKHWDIFDADLTELGLAQAKSLNSMLGGGDWFKKITGGRPVRAVVSPLTRCLNTASNVLKGLALNATSVEELCRETLGEDTCDARRSVSDPPVYADGGAAGPNRRKADHPCKFDKGLQSKFPGYKFRVYGPEDEEGRGFGLLGDEDSLWTKGEREVQRHQVKRAKRFLDILFNHAPEKVVVIITHSGFARSLLLAVQREPYRPNNAELVPVIVDKLVPRGGPEEADEDWDVGLDATGDGGAAPQEAPTAKAARRESGKAGRPLRGAAAVDGALAAS